LASYYAGIHQINSTLGDIGSLGYWNAYGHALNHSAKFILPFQEKFYVPIGAWGVVWSGLHVLLAPLLALLLGTAIRQKVSIRLFCYLTPNKTVVWGNNRCGFVPNQ